MLNCPKCGHNNELGRIFCHRCGAKLDLDQIKPPSRGGKSLHRKKTIGPRQIIRRVIDLAVIAVIVWVIYLLVQVPAIRPIETKPENIQTLTKRRLAFELKMDRRQDATLEITEAELNAYLGQFGFGKAEGRGLAVNPTQFQVETGSGAVSLVLLGEIRFGGDWTKRIHLRYTGVPAIKGGHLVFEPVAGVIGALPIHPWLLENTGLMARYFGQILGNFTEDQQQLERLATIEVQPGRVTLVYRPPS
jgi:hypothetical protein